MAERTIIHMDLDSFFVSVERLINSSLMAKPVIVGGNSDRGVVAACSYEARQFGVHSAMPMRMAKRLCPQAIYVQGDYDQYSRYSKIVTSIIAEKAPLFEKASIDEHYIDISGMDRYVMQSMLWGTELRQLIIKETGLPISFGMSVNKTVSKIATNESKPNGALQVEKDLVRPFLNPLSVNKMPMIGEKTGLKLRSMGIFTIESLSKVPPNMMIKVLGEHGRSIWEKANGIDLSTVEPYTERKSISAERTFEKDTTDMELLESTLLRMSEDLGFQLRKEKKLASTIGIKIRFSDFNTQQQQCRVYHTATDHSIYKVVKDLFHKLYNKRLLIRLVGVKLSGLVAGSYQAHLFEDNSEMLNLYQAMDKVKNRFGKHALYKASCTK